MTGRSKRFSRTGYRIPSAKGSKSPATMRTITTVLLVVLVAIAGQAQSLYKVELDERINRADLVVEARVVGQETTWNRVRTLIYTINRLKVYRLFKGDLEREALEDATIEVITPGGVFGLDANLVFPSLLLRPGDVGVLFASA